MWFAIRELPLECDRVDANLRNKAGSTALDIARKCETMHEIAQSLDECAKVSLHRREADEMG